MGSTYTSNLGLRKPENRDPVTYNAWDQVVNSNMNTVDDAFGNRNYTEQNYIANADSHTLSIDKLDMKLKDLSDVAPTANQKLALVGEGTPSGSNLFVTKSYVRLARKEVLFPEFASATFALAPGGLNTGTLSTDVMTHGDYIYNHYKWVSSEAVLNSYDISVQWRVPDTFLTFHLTKAVVVDICTQSTNTANCKVVAILSKDGTVGTSASADSVSLIAEDWQSEREGSEVISFTAADAVLLTLTAGDTLNVAVRVYSKDDYYVKVGAITFQYTG